MSQFYDQASLVMVPSGYKAGKVYSQKPLSTDGELTFTRNSNATRVNADGLVEKVRQNVLLYSNTYTAWTKQSATVTSGQTGYDGSSNAWLFVGTTAIDRHTFYRSNAAIGAHTISFYAKASGHSFVQIASVQTTEQYANFNLTAGTVGNVGTDFSNAQITSVGNDWYRISATANDGVNSLYVSLVSSATSYWLQSWAMPNATDGVLIMDGQIEASDFGPTPFIGNTTSAAVSVGPTANVPRLNYSNGCPSLLLEPQRTNSATFNERLASGTFSYVDGVTFTANSITAPTGYTQGCKFEKTGSGVADRYDALGGGPMSQSIFVKAGTSSRIVLSIEGNVTGSVIFDLSTLGITNNGTATGKIVDFGNGWYRCIANYSSTPTSGPITRIYLPDTGYLYCYGYQMELNASYETSLIPTLGASVTRLADAAYKTGISSLIGQTEGTIFVEFDLTQGFSNNQMVLTLSDNTSSNYILIQRYLGGLGCRIDASGAIQVDSYPASTSGGKHKIALAYALNDVKVYLDGSAIITDTSVVVPSMSKLSLGSFYNESLQLGSGINQALLFKTRLTNAQLAELTTL